MIGNFNHEASLHMARGLGSIPASAIYKLYGFLTNSLPSMCLIFLTYKNRDNNIYLLEIFMRIKKACRAVTGTCSTQKMLLSL